MRHRALLDFTPLRTCAPEQVQASEPRRSRRPMDPLIELSHLQTGFPVRSGMLWAVNNVSLGIGRGEVLGLLGESGCGKSMLALSMLRLVPDPGRLAGGSIRWQGNDLMAVSEARMCRIRGREVALVPQDALAALCPDLRIRAQVARILRQNRSGDRGVAIGEFYRILTDLGIDDCTRVMKARPAQLSGGMRQRVVLAMALVCRPVLLLADEPTSSLDVTTEGLALVSLERLAAAGSGVLLISHSVDVIAAVANRTAVMYAGRIVEEGGVAGVLQRPLHPYTAAMLTARPPPPRDSATGMRGPLPELTGAVPDLACLPAGCAFAPRCPKVHARCWAGVPALHPVEEGRKVACFLYHDETAIPQDHGGVPD